jgi:hypothetical protein
MLPLVTRHPFAIDEFRRTCQSQGEMLLPRRRASPRGLYQLLQLCPQLHLIFAVRPSPTSKLQFFLGFHRNLQEHFDRMFKCVPNPSTEAAEYPGFVPAQMCLCGWIESIQCVPAR